MSKVIDLGEARRKKQDEIPADKLSATDRMQRIHKSLEKINRLMSELKQMTKDFESRQDRRQP